MCTEDGLQQLNRAQLFSIAFENLDIQLGRKLNLEPAALFNKMVSGKRGGYCFELNSLYLMALETFGFRARPILARVRLRGETPGRSHLLLLVTIKDREWIADVGFGANGLRSPVPLEHGRVTVQDNTAFRLIDDGEFGTMLQTGTEDGWQNMYSFDKGVVCSGDIEMSNYFTETHPRSSFVKYRIAFLPVPDGNRSLLDFSLKIVRRGEAQLTRLEPGEAYLKTLESVFGIRLDTGYDALKPVADE
jgi:N-hydroxyarylamine O-acetyltransferase